MRVLLLLLLVLLYSCGSDSVGGSISEAGNAKVSCTVVGSDNLVQSGLTVALVPVDFDPVSGDRTELQFALSDTEGKVSFVTKGGEYNLWGQLETELLFSKGITLNSEDTLVLPTQIMSKAGTVILHGDTAVRSVYAKGFPFPFSVSKSGENTIASAVPVGQYSLILQSESTTLEQQTTIFSSDTTFINRDFNWTHWNPEPLLSSVYALYATGDTLFIGGGLSLGAYENSTMCLLSSANSDLPSNWILGIQSFEDRIYFSTEIGVAFMDAGVISVFDEIAAAKMSRFVVVDEKLWYTHATEAGAIKSDAVVERFTQAEIGTGNNILSALPELDTFWIGTQNDGLYYKVADQWEKDTSFSANWNQQELYFVDRYEGKLWLSTTGGGIYCRENDMWTNFTVASGDLPSDSIYATLVDTVDNRMLFGTKEGHLISYSEGVFTTIDAFRTSINNAGIFAINRHEEKLYLGTFGQGMVVLEYQD